MIWGDDAEVKVLETQNKVCSAMTESEKTESKLSNQQKVDVAEASQTTREDVEDVLQKHKQLQGFHQFLCQRRDRGEHMPETREELMQIYKVERPKFLMPKQHKSSSPRRKMVLAYRRHLT